MDLDERLKRIEAELAAKSKQVEARLQRQVANTNAAQHGALERIGIRRVETPQGLQNAALRRLPRVSHRVDIGSHRPLQTIDQIMESEFETGRFFDVSLADYPTTYCETPREYVEPILNAIPMTDKQREETLREIESLAERGQAPDILSSLGMHLPGVGCFVNGWYISRMIGVTPRDVFSSPEGLARVVTTASHEKWGHGFITELTAVGQEKETLQLGMIHVADQFSIQTVDTPEHARLVEQWNLLHTASVYVEEGFATWIERYLAERMAQQTPGGNTLLQSAPKFSLSELLSALSGGSGARQCREAIVAVFNTEAASLDTLHEAMQRLEAALEKFVDDFARSVGITAPYALGYCFMDAIAKRQGPKCVPYAVATACNIQYDLARVSNSDLEAYLREQPNLNVNTRLAACMFVSTGRRNDVPGFLTRIRDEAGLTPPVEQ